MRLLLVCVLLLLSACAPTFAPPGDSHMTPLLADDAIVARDGMRLPLRRWEADKPRAVIVALHGGTVRCEAGEGGRGTRMVIELPG